MRNERVGYIIRLVVSAYLVYLGVHMLQGVVKGEVDKHVPLIVIAGIAFLVFAVVFAVLNIRNLIRYQPPQPEEELIEEPREEPEEEQEVSIEEMFRNTTWKADQALGNSPLPDSADAEVPASDGTEAGNADEDIPDIEDTWAQLHKTWKN